MTCTHIKSNSYCKICETPPEKKKRKPIKKVSAKNKVKTSEGESIVKAIVEAKIKKAKREFKRDAIKEGKGYCQACGTTSAHIGVSHIISVDQCQKDGRVEQAWNKDNMQLECSEVCHIQTEVRNFDHHANARYKRKFIEEYNSISQLT